MIAATLEQKVHVHTAGSSIYPNLYVFLVAPPGIGKSRSIKKALELYRELPEPHVAPTSVTMASLVDHLVEAKRVVINLPFAPLEYNSMVIAADELAAFMHEYSGELVAGLTTFYDSDVPYGQGRRVKDIRIKIQRPQLNIICGSTPVKLTTIIPETAWDDGFMSRILMVYSDETHSLDIFKQQKVERPPELAHDLKVINTLIGEFGWTEAYAKAMNDWRELGYPDVPNHPRLQHYCTRREAHMLKLSMIANVDRGNELELDKQDFNKAIGWLLEAEINMPNIFKSGSGGLDAKAMDEIAHYVDKLGEVTETQLVRFARDRVRAGDVLRVLSIMERAGQIVAIRNDRKTGLRVYASEGNLPCLSPVNGSAKDSPANK